MSKHLLEMLINILMRILTPELLMTFADMTLDFVEEYVEGSKSTVDDKLVLPLCKLIRETYGIID